MKLTTNYSLKKPEGSDVVNIDDFNYNADTIDSKLKAIETQSNTNKTNILTLQSEVSANKTNISNLNSKTDKINEDIKSFKNENILLNGDFSIQQEGIEYKVLNRDSRDYVTDMWLLHVLGDASDTSNFVNILHNPTRLATKSVRGTCFKQYIEREKLTKLLNKKLTLSFKVMSEHEVGVCVQFINADVTYHKPAENIVPSYQPGKYHIVSSTFTINSLNDVHNPFVELYIGTPYNNNGWFDVLSAKLEIGEVATEHTPTIYETELLRCQRYYEKKWSRSMNSARSNNWLHFLREFVPKYTQPTVTVLDPVIRDFYSGNPLSGFTYREPYFYQNAIEINFEKVNHGQQASSLECTYILDSRLW